MASAQSEQRLLSEITQYQKNLVRRTVDIFHSAVELNGAVIVAKDDGRFLPLGMTMVIFASSRDGMLDLDRRNLHFSSLGAGGVDAPHQLQRAISLDTRGRRSMAGFAGIAKVGKLPLKRG